MLLLAILHPHFLGTCWVIHNVLFFKRFKCNSLANRRSFQLFTSKAFDYSAFSIICGSTCWYICNLTTKQQGHVTIAVIFVKKDIRTHLKIASLWLIFLWLQNKCLGVIFKSYNGNWLNRPKQAQNGPTQKSKQVIDWIGPISPKIV